MSVDATYGGLPVAVIGNGPVGQTTALLLARWGIPVLLLDARDERDVIGSKAICQQGDVLDIWAGIGATAVASEGVTWTTARTFYQDQELFHWSFAERQLSTIPPFVNISQQRTEEILDEQIANQPLIDVRWGHRVIDLVEQGTELHVTAQTLDGPTRFRVTYAVACAGARGEGIRDLLGVTFEGHSFDDRFLICDIRAELPGWETERRFYFDPPWNPGRQVLIHPCPDSTFRIDWQVPATFDLDVEAEDGSLDRRIRDIIGERPYEIIWKSVYRFHARRVDRMRVGRVLLAGDCAHLVAPFGARGLNSGVADADNVAWKIACVLHGWAPESLLDSYDLERGAAARENLAVTSDTMRFLVPRNDEEWDARRRLLHSALSDPNARSEVDSGRFAEPFWYIDSPLTTPSATRRFAGRPQRGHIPRPVPGVLVPDGPVRDTGASNATRLRDLSRQAFLALTTEGVDPSVVDAELKEATSAPTRVAHLPTIDHDHAVRDALDAQPGETWLIRPDGHIAAVLNQGDAITVGAATRQALGMAC
jgi:3-(3-hydroxy-phenyl)propionate hydroxylase